MNTEVKVFLSCAFGALIGGLVAFQVNHYFWWLGLIAGFLGGYLSYEGEKVAMAIPIAWRQVHGWHPDWLYWHYFWHVIARQYLLTIGCSASLLLPLCLLLAWLIIIESHHWGYADSILFWIFASGPLTFPLIATCMIAAIYADCKKAGQKLAGEDPDTAIEGDCTWFLDNNIFRVYFYKLPRFLWKKLPAVLAIGRIMGRFFRNIFVLIHSDIRLLCGCYAAIGAGIGYFTGNVLVGTLAGGVIGLLNYKVISQWWLGLISHQTN